ncbi:hypothetical protein TrVFT333_005278 [Trichoderma virens FT-333]|nr:hypothetical protein TrVFT333_005278 [Trichoderma virens FT-333]
MKKAFLSDHWSRATAANDTGSYAPHVLTQVDKLHAEGYTGKGIRIGIVDSGVDFNHPVLGGCFGKGCIIGYGMDLIGDAFNGTNTPVPGPYPHDCLGHGTHVSGIIAAQKNPLGFIGAAYGATLGMYKALNCAGVSSNDVLIAAFNQAYEDGSDIISLSVGIVSGWKEDPLSITVSRIIDAGVPCVIANGNNGPSVFSSATPADGSGVILNSPSDNLTSFAWIPGTHGTWSACNPLNDGAPADLSDKIVLVELDVCGDSTIADNLSKNNATYIMFYNSDYNLSNLYSVNTSPNTLGAGMVALQLAAEWRDLLGNGTEVYATMIEPQSAGPAAAYYSNDSDGGYVDDFSSWGPTWEADLNPHISTPGGSILSTYPLNMGGYYVDSGTSMAAPIMASIYALIMQARSISDPKALMSLVSSTAKQTKYYDSYQAKITAEITLPQGLTASNLPVYGGYITLSGSNGENLVIPYLGVAGSLANAQNIDPNYSFIYHTSGRFPQAAPDNDTWTIPYPTLGSQPSASSSIDYPALGIEVDSGVPLLRADIIPLGNTPAKTTKVLGVDVAGSLVGYPVKWLNTNINQVAFNGVTQEGTILPEGNYAVLLRALKIFGDVNNPNDYVTKQTQSFNIKYASTAA